MNIASATGHTVCGQSLVDVDVMASLRDEIPVVIERDRRIDVYVVLSLEHDVGTGAGYRARSQREIGAGSGSKQNLAGDLSARRIQVQLSIVRARGLDRDIARIQ